MRRWLISGLIVIFALAAVLPALATDEAATGAAQAEQKIAKKVGDQVPVWDAKVIGEAERLSSKDIKGNYGLVFVNSSCASCRAELDLLSKEDLQGITIFIVSVDFNAERTAATYKEQLKLPYKVIDDSGLKLSEMFGFSYTPATIVISDGKLAYRVDGYSPRRSKTIIAEIKKFAK